MKMLQWFVVGVMGLVVTGGANAQEKKVDNAKLLIGTWEATKGDEEALPKGTLVEFTKDGKLNLTLKAGGKELKIGGTYKVAGDKFEITMKGPDGKDDKKTITINSISDKELATTDEDGKKLTLTRTK